MKQSISLFIYIIFTSSFGFAQDGTLDPTFGNGGIVKNFRSTASDIAIQTDGKIVTGGYPIMRFNTDGKIDSTFGTNGIIDTNAFSGGYDGKVAIQPDGKIVVTGFRENGIFFDSNVQRYNSNGLLDTSFGTNGSATYQSELYNSAKNIVLQSDGKIVVAGFTGIGYSDGNLIIRYYADGLIDSTFDNDGVATLKIESFSLIEDIKQQLDGKIVVAGRYLTDQDRSHFFVSRYNINGSLDTSFGLEGVSKIEFSLRRDYGKSIAIQNDGKIIIVGNTYLNPDRSDDNSFAIARLDSSGVLDQSFGIGGKVVTNIEINQDYAEDVLILPDGKILVAGHSDYYDDAHFELNTKNFVIIKYNSNGSIDSTFSDGGKLIISISIYNDYGSCLALQQDGKIIIGGYSINEIFHDFEMVRIENSLSLPVELTSFSASSTTSNIQLNWTTATESNNVGWEIQEKQNPLNPPLKNGETEGEWRKIGFVSGKGTTTELQTYSFTLPITHNPSQVFFRLKQIDADGKFAYSNELFVNLIPETYSLSQNYPNPFNPKTIISYALPKSGKVVLKVYDILGKEIAVLENGYKESGRYSVNFDGSSLSSGLYFYKLESGGFSQVRKFQLVK